MIIFKFRGRRRVILFWNTPKDSSYLTVSNSVCCNKTARHVDSGCAFLYSWTQKQEQIQLSLLRHTGGTHKVTSPTLVSIMVHHCLYCSYSFAIQNCFQLESLD